MPHILALNLLFLALIPLFAQGCDDNDKDDDDEVVHAIEGYFLVDCARVEACGITLVHAGMQEYVRFASLDFDVYLLENFSSRIFRDNPVNWPDDAPHLTWEWREKSNKNEGYFRISQSDLRDLAAFINDVARVDHSAMVFHLQETQKYATLKGKLWGNLLAAVSTQSIYGIDRLHEWESWGGDLKAEYENFVEELCEMFSHHPRAKRARLTPCNRIRLTQDYKD